MGSQADEELSRTKHITVWFQNRRQETKRHSRDEEEKRDRERDAQAQIEAQDEQDQEQETPSGSSKSATKARGTYDPVTGKWRPVPLSCISSILPPPPEKLAAITAITMGEITRENYLDKLNAPSAGGSGVHSARPGLGRTASGVLEEVLSARESEFGDRKRAPRKSTGEPTIEGEGEERNASLLALMSSSPVRPVETDVGEDDDDEDEDDQENIPAGTIATPSITNASRAMIGIGRASREVSLGRTTSLDLVASSSRTRRLPPPNPLRAVSGPSGPLHLPTTLGMRYRPVPSHKEGPPSKRPRTSAPMSMQMSISGISQISRIFRPRDSFSRSQSEAVLAEPSTPSTSTTSPPTPRERSMGRSFSFSSSSTGAQGLLAKGEEGATIYSRRDGVHVGEIAGQQRRREEADKEVLDAAQQLIEMFEGSREASSEEA